MVQRARALLPSTRGELEITTLNESYLKDQQLRVELLGRGFAWLDTGSYEGLADASDFVRTVQQRTGLYVACLEEIAFRNQWIDEGQLLVLGRQYSKTDYGKYILSLCSEYRKSGGLV